MYWKTPMNNAPDPTQPHRKQGISLAPAVSFGDCAWIVLCLATLWATPTYGQEPVENETISLGSAQPRMTTASAAAVPLERLAADDGRLIIVGVVIAVTFAGMGWLMARRSHGNAHIFRGHRAHDASPDDAGVSPEVASRARFAKKRLRLMSMLVKDTHKLLPSDLKIRDLMTTNVTTALPTTTANELREIFVADNIRHMLICDEEGLLVGIVSDRDLRNVSDHAQACNLMVACPTTVSSDSLVNDAITTLLYGHISSLPVVDDGRLVGILTTTDVVMTLQCALLAVEHMVRNLQSGRTKPIEALAI